MNAWLNTLDGEPKSKEQQKNNTPFFSIISEIVVQFQCVPLSILLQKKKTYKKLK